jgi:hypothetical protein
MKTLVSAVACVALAFAGCQHQFSPARSAATGDDELILRAHFIGSERLLKDKEAPALTEVWKLPSFADLRSNALNRFSRLPYLWLSNSLPKGAADQAGLVRPLLEDALAHPSFVEWRGSSFTLAARLPAPRATSWDANLRQVVTAWRLGNPTPFTGGWELSRSGAPSLRFSRAGDWVAVTVGLNASLAQSNAVAQAQQFAKSSGGAWLVGDANLAQWKERLPLLENFSSLPVARFSLSNRAEFVRTTVDFRFAKPHGWKPEPWIIPTNAIWDPLVNFTVVRGVAGVLDSVPSFKALGWSPTPNQITGWASRQFPFQFYYAMPTRDVDNQLRRAAPQVFNEVTRIGGTQLQGAVVWDTNRQDITWRGLPVAVPALSSYRESNQQFLVAQTFPLIRTKERPPAELFAQFMKRDDVVLYDWEATQFRIPHWRQLYQLGELATHRPLTPPHFADQRWQTDLMNKLGESITEVRSVSPTQMTLTRKSSIGLTAFEVVTLSRWVESAGFPAFGIYPPLPSRRPPQAAGAAK